MRDQRFRILFRKLLVIVVAWTFIGFIVSLYDHFVLHAEMSSGPSSQYYFPRNLIFNMAAGFMGSVMGGVWLVFFVNEKLRDRPYGQTLVLVGLSFLVIVAIIMVVLGSLQVWMEIGNWPLIDPLATDRFFEHLSNPLHLKNIVVWSCVTLLTQFLLQINDKFGQGLLWDFIRGKYHTPQHEDRVFMFLDLKSSTTIAEKLGNEKYYGLLKDFYADMTNSIIYNEGLIYQYVGDEVVISWKKERALIDQRCIRCFFDIQRTIISLSDKYNSRYGLVPEFKAAMHVGKVVAGEIGIIKKDITYSGDVLNTTARIMSKCNEFKKKLLISGTLHDALENSAKTFIYQNMGSENLRGKAVDVQIYAVAAATLTG